MKREITPVPRLLLFTYRVIVALILGLLVILVAGSVFAFFRSPNSGPLFRIGGNDNINQGGNRRNTGDVSGNDTVNIFSDIGRLRIPVAGWQSEEQHAAVVILSINFPYPVNDGPFSEELASCTAEFRSIAVRYFSSLSPDKLINLDEGLAKAEILRQYNTLLRLGKIETLYFSDFVVVH
jgi:flagellar basal body-associated protein FliL